MKPTIVAGEPVEILSAALRQMKYRKSSNGMIRFSAMLDRELGEPLLRALTRIERELLDQDRHRGAGVHARTPAQRRADALVVLVDRLAEAWKAT